MVNLIYLDRSSVGIFSQHLFLIHNHQTNKSVGYWLLNKYNYLKTDSKSNIRINII